MAKGWTGFGLAAMVVVMTMGAVAPASAEFFGCDDQKGKVLRSYSSAPRYSTARASYAQHVVSPPRVKSTWSLSASGKRRAW